MHHAWLSAWPQFPRNAGPWWLGWLLHGHLAVAVFIVVSGFSLALAPLRDDGLLIGGARRFLMRRAWRILPPYWAALIFSTILAATLLEPRLGSGPLVGGFVVHGLLLQDAIGSATPNGAFWSIAVEWQIYFVFPLILWLGRRTGLVRTVLATIVIVVIIHMLAGLGSPLTKLNHLTPQFLALFAVGVLAAKLGRGSRSARRPLTLAATLTLGGLVALMLREGSVWIVARYFWIDIAFGVGVACLLAVMHNGGLLRLARLLASRPALRLGLFSYSIYLIHGPLVGLLDQRLIGPLHMAPLVNFGLLLGLGVPLILLACYAFHLLFEAPFLHRRDLGALLSAPLIQRVLGPKAVADAGIAPAAVRAGPDPG